MTKVNLKVKLNSDDKLVVDRFFVGVEYVTDVWISKKAAKALVDFGKKDQAKVDRFTKKLKSFATKGFANFEGAGDPIRHEGNEVYRVGLHWSLFRLLGFYEDGHGKSSFIVIDGMQKRGQKLSDGERGRIDTVAKVKKKKAWKKAKS